MNGFLRQTLLYSISTFLMKGVSLILLPFVAHYLSPEEFGQLEILVSMAVIGSILLGLGLEDALFKFAGGEPCEKNKRAVSSHIYGVSLLFSICAFLILIAFSKDIVGYVPFDLSHYSVCLVIGLLSFEGLIAIPLGWVRMRDKAHIFCGVSLARVLLQAGLTLVMLNLGRGINGILEANLIAACCQGVFLSVWHFKDTGFYWLPFLNKRLWPYCWPIVASGILMFVFNGLDRWVLAQYSTVSTVGLYGIAAKFALGVAILMQPFGIWWSPKRFEILNRVNGLKKVAYFSQLGIVLCGGVTLSVLFIGPVVIRLILPVEYHGAAYLLTFLCCAMAFKELTEIINIGCFHTGSTAGQFYVNAVSSVIAVALMIVLTQYFNVLGLVIAIALAYFVRMAIFYWLSQKNLTIPYRNCELFKFAFTLAAGVLLSVKLQSSSNWLVIFVGYCVSMLALALSALSLLDHRMDYKKIFKGRLC